MKITEITYDQNLTENELLEQSLEESYEDDNEFFEAFGWIEDENYNLLIK